jgi:hypothetical protein
MAVLFHSQRLQVVVADRDALAPGSSDRRSIS